jgi:hypothetical protein
VVVALFHDAEPSIGLGGLALISVPASRITGLARVSVSALSLLVMCCVCGAPRGTAATGKSFSPFVSCRSKEMYNSGPSTSGRGNPQGPGLGVRCGGRRWLAPGPQPKSAECYIEVMGRRQAGDVHFTTIGMPPPPPALRRQIGWVPRLEMCRRATCVVAGSLQPQLHGRLARLCRRTV